MNVAVDRIAVKSSGEITWRALDTRTMYCLLCASTIIIIFKLIVQKCSLNSLLISVTRQPPTASGAKKRRRNKNEISNVWIDANQCIAVVLDFKRKSAFEARHLQWEWWLKVGHQCCKTVAKHFPRFSGCTLICLARLISITFSSSVVLYTMCTHAFTVIVLGRYKTCIRKVGNQSIAGRSEVVEDRTQCQIFCFFSRPNSLK